MSVHIRSIDAVREVTTLTGATLTFNPPKDEGGIHTVTKRGGSADLKLQAYIMATVGKSAFAAIYETSADGYRMERLLPQPAPLDALGLGLRLLRVRNLLATHVWSRGPVSFPRPDFWQEQTRKWLLQHALYLVGSFDALYPSYASCYEHMIHGDPTLSNVMLRNDLTLCLIDPAPPRYAVPQLKEVDLGKLLQSAAGWERLSCTDWPQPDMEYGDLLHDLCDGNVALQRKALWWAAFHCARIAARYDDPLLVRWGNAASRMFAEKL